MSARQIFGGQGAVSFDLAGEGGGVQPFLGDLGKGLLEGVERVLGHGAACRHGVAAELEDDAGVALGHQVQRIAQVKAGDGAARALELMLLARRAAGGKHEGGAVQLVLDAAGHDAHHAFVKVRGRTR